MGKKMLIPNNKMENIETKIFVARMNIKQKN